MRRQRPGKLLVCLLILVLCTGLLPASAQQGVPPGDPGVAPSGEAGIPPGLEAPSALEMAFYGNPEYDSGWVPLAQGEAKILTHNVGGNLDQYVVDMQYRAFSVDGINNRYYGGADFGANPAPEHSAEDRVGAYWRSLTTSTVTVYRRPEDSYAEQVRIRIWVDPGPNYDSGWISIAAGAVATTLTHNLGYNPDRLVVDMQYRSPGDGVNQRYFGGADFGAQAFSGAVEDDRVGLYWRSLDANTISLFRRDEDPYAPEVRIRIWIRPNPSYDSGWIAVNPDQAITLAHNLGGEVGFYQVYMDFRSPTNGINQRHLGGADFGANPPAGSNPDDRVGAYWRSLTEDTITVYRRPEDIYAPEVRIRIWTLWLPGGPDYDSGWIGVAAGDTAPLTHNLGGSLSSYFVDTQYRSSSVDGINLRYYGGADFGVNPAPEHAAEDRVGVYWRNLTTSTVTVFRRSEDTYAEQVRVRIWVAPKPDYDSGWVAIGQDAIHTFNHLLKGSTLEYLVDLQYRNPLDGVNQRYYGGADYGANPSYGGTEDSRVGAYWRSLTPDSITVYRRPEDPFAPEVRVRIWRVAEPSFHTPWVALAQDESQTRAHNLGFSPEFYLVDMLQYDNDIANYMNQRHLGGADFGVNPPTGYDPDDRVGSYWRTLTGREITVYRRPEDGFADWVYVRIWNYTQSIFLPVVQNSP